MKRTYHPLMYKIPKGVLSWHVKTDVDNTSTPKKSHHVSYLNEFVETSVSTIDDE